MEKLQEIRRRRLRAYCKKTSATEVSKRLGYAQGSFISQIAGPKPTRDFTEKSARSFEKDLGLEEGYFDIDEVEGVSSLQAPEVVALFKEVILLVGHICASENISLHPSKFAEVIILAYEDTLEHGNRPRPHYISQIVTLLKP